MGWLSTITSFIPGGKFISGLVSLGSKLLGNERREKKLDTELKSQKVAAREKRKRALIKASPWPLRLFALANSFAVFYAPAWPGVTVEDTIDYVDSVINGMPDWYVQILLLEYSFLWGGAEAKSWMANRDDNRLAEKEVERDTEEQKAKQVQSQSEEKPEGYYDRPGR